MTKEEIIQKLFDPHRFLAKGSVELVEEAMEAYKNQELSELQAKYDKLKEEFESLLLNSTDRRFSKSDFIRQANQIEDYRNKWLKKAGLTE